MTMKRGQRCPTFDVWAAKYVGSKSRCGGTDWTALALMGHTSGTARDSAVDAFGFPWVPMRPLYMGHNQGTPAGVITGAGSVMHSKFTVLQPMSN